MEVLIREEEPKNAAEQARAASVLFTLLVVSSTACPIPSF